ncbi:hypothetical protein BDN70DRAFT_899613 [Pholiota conissans]|uniref:Uncharacterized protein n=1 Tax=Pholiota conissans TaxID=109636 RepID=A0A9P5YR90_9AGAR|nr:hypothetical protein BDN70DRAFT_899613 [Pholiota conissans]
MSLLCGGVMVLCVCRGDASLLIEAERSPVVGRIVGVLSKYIAPSLGSATSAWNCMKKGILDVQRRICDLVYEIVDADWVHIGHRRGGACIWTAWTAWTDGRSADFAEERRLRDTIAKRASVRLRRNGPPQGTIRIVHSRRRRPGWRWTMTRMGYRSTNDDKRRRTTGDMGGNGMDGRCVDFGEVKGKTPGMDVDVGAADGVDGGARAGRVKGCAQSALRLKAVPDTLHATRPPWWSSLSRVQEDSEEVVEDGNTNERTDSTFTRMLPLLFQHKREINKQRVDVDEWLFKLCASEGHFATA